MQTDEACKFAHKNDILSRIEEILSWTKSENDTWDNNFFLTSAAYAVLLKTGHAVTNININWLKKRIAEFEETRKHLRDDTLFCGFCLGLLSLSYSKEITKKELSDKGEALAQELWNLNWMNSPRTIAFLVLFLKENELTGNIRLGEILKNAEEYLTTSIKNSTLNNEGLVYALYALSMIDSKRAKEYISNNLSTVKDLTNHGRIEIRTLSLNILDHLEIPCAEKTYQGIWSYFDERRYGVIERSIIQKLTWAVYNRIAGSHRDTNDVKILEKDDKVRVEIGITRAGLESMVRNAPPLDNLVIVALAIVFSNYDQVFTYSKRKNENYQRLINLDNKSTYIPLEKTALFAISEKIYRYELAKIVIKNTLFAAAALIALPYLLSILAGYLPMIPDPWSEAIGGAFGIGLGLLTIWKGIYTRAKKRRDEIRSQIKLLRSKGEWQKS